jgi:phenylacetate-CoA ligase
MEYIREFYRSFDERVRDIVAYGYAHSPAFQRRMQAASLQPVDITGVAALERLPAMRKEELVTLQQSAPDLGGMLTVPATTLRRIFQSPGPIHDPEPNEADSWRWAPALRAAGFGPGDIVLNCFSYHLTPAAVMFEEGARMIGCAVVPAGVGNQQQQIDAMIALGVTAYVGLPSYLKALLDKAREAGHDPKSWPLAKAMVTAEPLPPSLRSLLQDEYGIEVFNVYGTAECGNLGYEGRSHQGWHLPDDALVQVCDINSGAALPPGETGEVIVTLFRRDYILVRFAVGDLSALMNIEPAADIANPRLVGWLGRSGDSVKVRGIFVHPRKAAEALADLPGLAGYQVVVSRHDHRDELRCRIVVEAGHTPEPVAEQVATALQESLKLRVAVDVVGNLPTDAPAFLDERRWE